MMLQIPPHFAHLDKRRQYRRDSVKYSKSDQVLDVWRGDESPQGAPVLIWLPGGGWASASRFTMQGHALMSKLVEQGWVCLSADYRTAPQNRWPSQLDDALWAVEWARNNAERYGGDPNFVAIAGASAGGHLATLTGLQGAVDAVASIYGSYDWESWDGWWRHLFMGYLERVVVGKRQCHHPEVFAQASPLAQANEHLPPMIMVHGTHDSLISVAEARRFAERSGAEYVEISGAGHGFDIIDAGHAQTSNKAIVKFLERVSNR